MQKVVDFDVPLLVESIRVTNNGAGFLKVFARAHSQVADSIDSKDSVTSVHSAAAPPLARAAAVTMRTCTQIRPELLGYKVGRA